MDALQVLAPLVGVVLGSALSGIGAQIRARGERKRIIGTALADLLEVRHRVVAFNLIVRKVQSLAGVRPEAMPEVRNLLDSMVPIDGTLGERYTQAVNMLAGIDPVLAFSLRSRQDLPKFLAVLRTKAIAGGADLGVYETFESQLLDSAKPSLDSAVLELARSHSFLTARKVRAIVKKSGELPKEVSSFFDRLAQINPQTVAPGKTAV